MKSINYLEWAKTNLRQKKINIQNEILGNEEESQRIERLVPLHIGMKSSKIILVFSFILMAFNILRIANLEQIGYVVNIYSVLPGTLVPSLIVCFSIACFLVFSKSVYVRYASIILLFIVLLTILSIPYSLGYYSMGRTDDLSYIGEYLHISDTGHIAGWDIYPAGLTLGANIKILNGIGASTTSFIIPIFFSVLFIMGLYIFGCRFSKDKGYRTLLLISSFILYLGPYNFLNTPHALFFALLPIYLYVILKYVESKDISSSVLIIIFSLLLPFTHPFIFFFVVLIMISLLIIKPVIKKLVDGDLNRLKTPLFIQLICFMAWFTYSGGLLGDFQKNIYNFLHKITVPVLLETTNKVAASGLDPLTMSKFLFIYYGRYIIPTIIIIAFFLIYYRRIALDSKLKRNISLLLLMYSIAFIAELFLFLNPIISHQPDRMSNLLFLVILQVPLFAFALIVFLKKQSSIIHRSTIRKTIVILVIISTFGLSLIGTFDSPNVNRINAAVTNNEVKGMQWIYEYREGQNMAATVSQIERFHDLFDDGLKDNIIKIPDHFGYNGSEETFTESVTEYKGPLYIVTFTLDKSLYEEVPGYHSLGRYYYEDYQRYLYDNSVDRVYVGQNIDISLSNR